MSEDLGVTLSAPEIAPASEAPAPAQEQAPQIEKPAEAKAPDTPVKREPKSIADALKSARSKVETQQATSDRQRDEQGRFVPKTDDGTPPEPKPPTAKPEAKEGQSEAKPAADAPSRFSADAKAAWGTTPEPVKAEVSRAFRELETGLQQYQQRFEPLKPFYALAERHGTTVEQALDNYTRMDFALRENPDSVLPEIFRVAGINPHEWAARLLNTQPDQAAAQYQNTIAELRGELASMKQQMQQFNGHIQTQEEQRVMAEVNSFKATHPRFDELQGEIVRMLETGYAQDLEEAYQRAEKLIPSPAPAAPAATPAQQPQPLKRPVQVSGAPSPGSNPAQRKPSSSIQESLRRAASMTGVRG